MPPQQGEGLRGGTRPSPCERWSGSCCTGPFSQCAFSWWQDGEVDSQTKPSALQVGTSQQGRGKSCLTTAGISDSRATTLKTPILLPIAAQNQSCPTQLPFQNRLSSAPALARPRARGRAPVPSGPLARVDWPPSQSGRPCPAAYTIFFTCFLSCF